MWMSISDYIDVENFKAAAKTYGKNPPFDHMIIDDFFKPDIASQLESEFPDFDSEIWHGYNNAIEVKRVCNNWNVFPPLTYKIFSAFNSDEFLGLLSDSILESSRTPFLGTMS